MHLDLLFIYFLYGLGFFTMGLVIALESFRKPSLGNAYQLIPLAVFGILHGIHEWLEIFLLQTIWLGLDFPESVTIGRLSLLGISFLFLLYFGIRSFQFKKNGRKLAGILFFSVLGIYYIFMVVNLLMFATRGADLTSTFVDVIIRYLLAFPSAIFASVGVFQQSREFRIQRRISLAKMAGIVAFGFLVYGLTQLFVPSIDLNPARFINQITFTDLFGFPVQLIRAFMAIIIMIGMVLVVSLFEKERQEQFFNAQKDRLDAMKQIQDELTQRETLRKEYLRHIVQAQEDERARIARELHDETSQVLSAFSLDLATLRKLSSRRNDLIKLVDRLQSLSKQMSQGLYRLVHDLRPAQLDDLGLVSALEYLTQCEQCPPGLYLHLEKCSPGFHSHLKIEGRERRLDPIVETVLFRVAQEALTNSCKHSQSDYSSVSLIFDDERVLIRIEDQGIGFNTSDSFPSPRGWGLAGMQERVESVGGIIKILSSPGNGTIIEVIVPSKNDKKNME